MIFKRLLGLEFKSNRSIKTTRLKWIVKKKYCQVIKIIGKRIRKMAIPPKQKMEHAYCVSCKKSTGNSDMSSKQLIIK